MDVSDLIAEAVEREVSRQLKDATKVGWGTVTQVSPLRVRRPGDTVGTRVGRVDSYTPTVDDRVVLVKVGRTRWVALGVYVG